MRAGFFSVSGIKIKKDLKNNSFSDMIIYYIYDYIVDLRGGLL